MRLHSCLLHLSWFQRVGVDCPAYLKRVTYWNKFSEDCEEEEIICRYCFGGLPCKQRSSVQYKGVGHEVASRLWIWWHQLEINRWLRKHRFTCSRSVFVVPWAARRDKSWSWYSIVYTSLGVWNASWFIFNVKDVFVTFLKQFEFGRPRGWGVDLSLQVCWRAVTWTWI